MGRVFPVRAKLAKKSTLDFNALDYRNIPRPVEEYKFLNDRGLRFDYAWPEKKLAIELEGGIWSRGRHVRGQGYLNDLEKYNLAVLEGWRVLRFAPNDIKYFLIELVWKRL